jgi:GPH family glycoside/pentoside/hexuronide:cation symporter
MGKEKVKPNWANPATTAENEKLPGWLKWIWSMRGLAFGINTVLMLQITYYCTDMLGLAPALVGTMLMASKVLDAFTDLIAGYIVDKTNTRWGKGRPYDVAISLTWLCTVLLFSTPSFGTVGKAVYVFIMYALVNSVCSTLCMVADPVYLGNAIRSDKNKMSVTSFQGAIIMIGATVMGIFIPQLVGTIGVEKSGWTIIALIFAVPSAIVGSIRMFMIKEVNLEKKQADGAKSNYSLGEGLKALSKNGFAILLCVLVVLNNTQQTIATAAANYYFKWIFGDVSLASLVSLPTMLTPLVLLFVPALSRKIGTGKVLKAGFVITVIGYVVRLAGGVNITTILIGSLCTAIGTIPIGSLLSIYSIECMDYGEKKTGIRLEGLIASTSSFAYKLGGGIGSGMLGIFMGMSGYLSSETATAQPDGAIAMIRFVFSGLPLAIAVIAMALSMFYNVNKDRA